MKKERKKKKRKRGTRERMKERKQEKMNATVWYISLQEIRLLYLHTCLVVYLIILEFTAGT